MLAIWPNLIRLHYAEENVKEILDDENNTLQTAHDAILGAVSFIKNLKRNLNNMTSRHYDMKLQEDALNGNIKSLTRKLMRKPSTGPQATRQILADPDNPRNKEGELI